MTSALHAIVINAPDLRPSTRAQYLRDLNAWITFAGAEPAGWTRQRVQDFYASLLARMKPASANRLMSSVKYASRWFASRTDATDFAVFQQASSGTAEPRHALTADQVAKLLDFPLIRPGDRRDFALLVLAVETGLRRMSLVGAAWEGLGDVHGYPTLAVPLKGRDAPYNVPVSDTALAALAPWRAARTVKRTKPAGEIFCAVERVLVGDLRVDRIVPGKLSTQAIYALVQRRGAAAGMPDLHPHLLRHTFVTWRLEAGLTPHQITSITGHRLAGDGLGSLATYADRRVAGAAARQTTPAWLAQFVIAKVHAIGVSVP